MIVVVDTSALLAVVLNEPQRPSMIAATRGCDLFAPAMLPFEVGNALTALLKRKRITPTEVLSAWNIFCQFPIDLKPIDISAALKLAMRHGIYAYDAYVTECAIAQRAELLTLDKRMQQIALAEGIVLRGAASP
jgi:predicted nucleic acid-binding protein